MAVKKIKSKINTWKPKKDEIIVERDGKLFICNFDKVFGYNENLKPYNRFLIGKESYINQLDTITAYTNFFINNYDFDKELPMGYLKVKFALDKEKIYNLDNLQSYIDFLYQVLFTDTMVEKIIQMVEENYLDDIETPGEEKKKYIKNEKKHLESLEFTNQHIKILLQISFGMKLMSPCIFHYVQINNIKIEKDSDIIFRFYKKLFSIFGFTTNYELRNNKNELIESDITPDELRVIVEEKGLKPIKIGDGIRYYFKGDDGETYVYAKGIVNMYNKLYVYVKAKVLESSANNAPIFAQREIFGIDVFSVINQFTKKVLISENMVKYKFNECWDDKQHKFKENIVGFNKTIIKFQLSYFLKDQYSKNLTEVTNAKNTEGLSGSDKMLMNSNKIDEGVVTLADINIEYTIAKIRRDIDVPLSEEEIQYYIDNHKPCDIQKLLVMGYYSKYFGGYRDLQLLTRRDYIILLLLLKKKLLIELGYEEDDAGNIHYASLPYILTGNLTDKVNTRIIRNNRFIAKLEESSMYQNLMQNKYRLLDSIKPEEIKKKLSNIVNTRFTYVAYEHQELIGVEIKYPEDKITDELLFFLNCI